MQTNTSNAKQDTQPAPAMRVLKIGTCPSLSESSTLTYHVGCDDKSDIYFRVFDNSSSGYFNKEWVSMDSIGKALGGSTNITSFTLHPIYKGKSLNNGGFLLAALKNEQLVLAPENEKVRSYQLGDPGKFLAEVKMLIESSVSLDADTKPKKVAAIKKAGNSKKVAAEATPLTAENCALE